MIKYKFFILVPALTLSLITVLFGSNHVTYAQASMSTETDTIAQEKILGKLNEKVEGQLGLYYTSMLGSSEDRIDNIKKAVKKINKEVIEPNETFSFNEVVGNSNIAQDGWKKAGTFLHGRLVDEYGGGICQVSSTLYNALVDTGLTITERHSHSLPVKYVPLGKDATIAYGVLDFTFTNPFDFPVKIKAKVYENQYVLIRIVKVND